jgi:urea carboxylase
MFGDGGVFLEKFVETGRHIEVQVFGDGKGKVVALGERECSIQRRFQKIIEESPSPGLNDRLRNHIHATAVKLCESIKYESVRQQVLLTPALVCSRFDVGACVLLSSRICRTDCCIPLPAMHSVTLQAGTVEFIFDQNTEEFYFLEVNTRLQVEHV